MKRTSTVNTRKKITSKYKFRSKFEKKVADELTKYKVPFLYEARKIHYQYPVTCNPCSQCGNTVHFVTRVYTPDFLVNNEKTILEPKGRLTAKERRKFEWILKSNPTIDLRLIFQRDNRIRPKSFVYYSDWAKKNNFTYIVGDKLPTNWIKEFHNGND